MRASPSGTPSDPAPETVSTSIGPVTLVDEGPRDAPVLVLVHGVPGSHRDFRYLAPLLVPELRVVRIDLPGFGGTPVPQGYDLTLPARAGVVIAVLDALGIDRASVGGHSMGGGTAIVLAARHPERVSGLVLLASVGPRRHRGMARLPPWAIRGIVGGLAVPGVREALLPRLRATWKRARFPGAGSMTAADFRFQLSMAAAADFGLLRASLAEVRSPAFVAWTDDDPLVEPEVSRELAGALPGATTLSFAEGGHNLQKTHAAAVADAIRAWAPRG